MGAALNVEQNGVSQFSGLTLIGGGQCIVCKTCNLCLFVCPLVCLVVYFKQADCEVNIENELNQSEWNFEHGK